MKTFTNGQADHEPASGTIPHGINPAFAVATAVAVATVATQAHSDGQANDCGPPSSGTTTPNGIHPDVPVAPAAAAAAAAATAALAPGPVRKHVKKPKVITPATAASTRPRRTAKPTKSMAEYHLEGDDLDWEGAIKPQYVEKQEINDAEEFMPAPGTIPVLRKCYTLSTYDMKFGQHLVRDIPKNAKLVTKAQLSAMERIGGKYKLLKHFITQRRFTPKMTETTKIFQAINVSLKTIPLFKDNKAPTPHAYRAAIQPIIPAIISCLLTEAGIEFDSEVLRHAMPSNTWLRSQDKEPMDRETALKILAPFIEPKSARDYSKQPSKKRKRQQQEVDNSDGDEDDDDNGKPRVVAVAAATHVTAAPVAAPAWTSHSSAPANRLHHAAHEAAMPPGVATYAAYPDVDEYMDRAVIDERSLL
jgi:hypothetical protein